MFAQDERVRQGRPCHTCRARCMVRSSLWFRGAAARSAAHGGSRAVCGPPRAGCMHEDQQRVETHPAFVGICVVGRTNDHDGAAGTACV